MIKIYLMIMILIITIIKIKQIFKNNISNDNYDEKEI